MSRTLVPALALVIAVACAEQPPPAAPTVSNPALGLRLAWLPPEFTVAVNEGDRLELEPTDPAVDGRLWFEIGPVETGLNLVAAVRGHQRRIEEQPRADYQGGQELMTPLGTAFYSRGRFMSGLTESEETAVFVRHPGEIRLLTITYRYPAGVDSSVRVQQLLDILGQVEPIGALGEPST